MADTGTVTISLDLELAWGMRDDLPAAYRTISDARASETAYLGRLLDRCDELEIPLTFATVGHLFLSSCDGSHGDLLSPADRAVDPGTSVDEDPLFYAPDLIETISAANTAHELATHTFTHVVCDSAPERLVDRELKAAADVHVDCGLAPPRSLVAPRNRLPEYNVLRDNDVDVVRVPRPDPVDSEPAKYRQRLRHWLVDRPPTVSEPGLVDGVLETYASPYPSLTAVHLPNGQRPPLAAFRAIPTSVRRLRHERYLHRILDAVVETGTHAHLWTHLYNLANEYQWRPIASFLDRLATLQRRGRVEVRTMSKLDELHRETREQNGDGDSRSLA